MQCSARRAQLALGELLLSSGELLSSLFSLPHLRIAAIEKAEQASSSCVKAPAHFDFAAAPRAFSLRIRCIRMRRPGLLLVADPRFDVAALTLELRHLLALLRDRSPGADLGLRLPLFDG
jgi:hypothetical protein